MNKLIDKLTQLFKGNNKVDPISIIHEQFDWNAIRYNGDKLTDIKTSIYQEYIDWLPTKTNRNLFLMMFDNGKSRGYALRGSVLSELNKDVFSLIKSHIEMLLSLGYRVNLSEVSTNQTSHGILTRYHVYLKPSLKLRQGPVAHQIYGNINIEYKIEDDMPIYFKVLAHTYQDQNFLPALPMHEMMQSFTQ